MSTIVGEKREAEIISQACKIVNLDGHIQWIVKHSSCTTYAEKIADKFRGAGKLPVKTSYMYCDTLDMCFFFDHWGKARVSFSGQACLAAKEFSEDKLINAFQKAKTLLRAMQELMDKELNRNDT